MEKVLTGCILGLGMLLGALVFLVLGASPAPAQAANLYWQCASSGGAQSWCPVSDASPVPVTGLAKGASALAPSGTFSPVGGSDGVSGRMALTTATGVFYSMPGPYGFVTRNSSGLVKSGGTLVHTVTVSPTGTSVTAVVLTIYNNTSASGAVLYTEYVPATMTAHSVVLDAFPGLGTYIGFDGTLAGVSVTVSYN